MNSKESHAYWMNVITECNHSGMCKSKWLKDHNIEEKRFYYWQHRFKLESARNSADESVSSKFIELKRPSISADTSSVLIHKGDFSVEVPDSVSDDFLLRIVKAVSNA